MDKQKLNWVTWAVLAIAVLLVALMLGGSLNRTAPLRPSQGPRRRGRRRLLRRDGC
nr:hypothetical protein [uncultured Oscillibacter sp.]